MITKLSLYDLRRNIYVAPCVHMRDTLPVYDANRLLRYDCIVCNIGIQITNKDFRKYIDYAVARFADEYANTPDIDLNQYKTCAEMNKALFYDCLKKNDMTPTWAFRKFLTVRLHRNNREDVEKKYEIETDGIYLMRDIQDKELDFKLFGYVLS